MEHARYKSSMVVNTKCPRNMYMSQAPRPYNLFHVHRSHMALSVRISNSCQQLEDREQESTGPPPPAVSATPNSNLFAKRRCIKIIKITAVSGTLGFNHMAKFLRKIRNFPFSTPKLLAPKPIFHENSGCALHHFAEEKKTTCCLCNPASNSSRKKTTQNHQNAPS